MREAGMKSSATGKKNARSWVLARSTAHKNLRWRMASWRRPNNSNFKHKKTVGVGVPQFWDCVLILGIEVAGGRASGLKARATGCAAKVGGRTL